MKKKFPYQRDSRKLTYEEVGEEVLTSLSGVGIVLACKIQSKLSKGGLTQKDIRHVADLLLHITPEDDSAS